MCVIIYSPEGTRIKEEELKNAWKTNSDGAGYAVQTEKGLKFNKGFLNYNNFIKEFEKYNTEKYNSVVHFRITSKGQTNKEQTHPFKKGDPNQLNGLIQSHKGVFFMNGTIQNLALKENLNDTGTYIEQSLKYLKGYNKHLLNLIEDATNSKWLYMNKDKIIYSRGFIEQDGLYYSNLYHKYKQYNYYDKYYIDFSKDYIEDNEEEQETSYLLNLLQDEYHFSRKQTRKLKNYIKENCISETVQHNCLNCLFSYVLTEKEIINKINNYDDNYIIL